MTQKTAFAPTVEQQVALALFATGKSLAIEAGAGTGKTSTLKLLAESTPRRGQYVAFNKAIVEEAKAKMPSTVSASTAHSLAYRNIVSRHGWMAGRLRHSARMKSTEIASRLRIEQINLTLQDDSFKRLHASYLAGVTMRAVIRFCQTADAEPGWRHVPYIDGIDLPPGARANNELVAKALEWPMRRAWADITNSEGSLPFRHDHYLKLWHLDGPRISADYILFDEAQDANPVLVDIIRQQEHAQLVWVGDSQQQIYSFTGAENALKTVGAEQTAMLTQSFRFGPEIAEVANRCLEGLNAPLRLTGTDTIPSRIINDDTVQIGGSSVILSRTNAAAVRELLATLRAGLTAHLVGGGRDVLDFAKAARQLKEEGFTPHPELACFQSWGEVQTYVDQDEQGDDLSLLVKLIDDFGVEQIIEALEHMPPEEQAHVILSTAHKAKGREWDSVKLAADFPADPRDEELRLLYVACTRAKLRLDISAIDYLADDKEDGYCVVCQTSISDCVCPGVEGGEKRWETSTADFNDDVPTVRVGAEFAHSLDVNEHLAAERSMTEPEAAGALHRTMATEPITDAARAAVEDLLNLPVSYDDRRGMRLEVLRDLLTLTEAGVDLDSDALREMIAEVEAATLPVDELTAHSKGSTP